MPTSRKTGAGQKSKTPKRRFDPPPAALGAPVGSTIPFQGEDGRHFIFDLSTCPSPGWHETFASILATWIGPAGRCRTLATARSLWDASRSFLVFLAENTTAASPESLEAADLHAYLAYRKSRVQESTAVTQFRLVAALLRTPPAQGRISPEAMAELTRRRQVPIRPGKPGYSPYELRVLTRAVRREVAQIRDRVLEGERSLASPPDSKCGTEAMRRWKALAAISSLGVVPDRTGPVTRLRERTTEAGQLFLTWSDMTSLLALLVVVSGRNVESLKELPTEYRILGGRAVELRLTKRRRGQHLWHETVTWEIGPPSRQLFTPGGLYLLVHQLTARSRAFSNSETLWSLWRNHQPGETASVAEHISPFAGGLHKLATYVHAWNVGGVIDRRTGLPLTDGRGELVRMDFQRLRKAVEVRRVRSMGGHLPSAARSNSVETLFGSYLRHDPTAHEWAQEVMGEALRDAESVTLSGPTVHPDDGGEIGEQTAWAACRDINAHPVTEGVCRVSFLDCFSCANCVITRDHLPAIVGLTDALAKRRQHMSEDDWQVQYGQVWTSIRRDVMPRFTPGELANARQEAPADTLLDLIEPGWERT